MTKINKFAIIYIRSRSEIDSGLFNRKGVCILKNYRSQITAHQKLSFLKLLMAFGLIIFLVMGMSTQAHAADFPGPNKGSCETDDMGVETCYPGVGHYTETCYMYDGAQQGSVEICELTAPDGTLVKIYTWDQNEFYPLRSFTTGILNLYGADNDCVWQVPGVQSVLSSIETAPLDNAGGNTTIARLSEIPAGDDIAVMGGRSVVSDDEMRTMFYATFWGNNGGPRLMERFYGANRAETCLAAYDYRTAYFDAVEASGASPQL